MTKVHSPLPVPLVSQGIFIAPANGSTVIAECKHGEVWGITLEQAMTNAAALARTVNRDSAFDDLVKALEACVEQCIGCATNHYGDDAAQFGLPSYITDAQAILAKTKAVSA